ncbi:gliding motility-associated C-terminal domain-containing protein [Flavobacterium sp. CYK-4]|uniref:gliding motility-associated C-terminal domain-containing protein n=1 Tax=Flavobacterium lotistagni TaxID=2709660 RepID=UPI00140AC359|nr:gliding motility-associated C-terminal domain-containing protein [Flavobacterium lotistagni]NHM07456.1 gliding motility-associated C-terminal domain-containing protein [Flavobacterium lotistagni]
MAKNYAFWILILLGCWTVKAQNLINNGDFESGSNGVGFNINSSFYNEITAPFSGNTQPGNYAVTNNPQPMNTNFFISGGDHTSGTGKMLVVDATSTGGAQRFWRAGSNGGGVCGLTVGVNYTFSFWVKSVSTQVSGPATQADFGYQVIGASNFTLISGSNTAPLPAQGWQQIVHTFTATNNCVNIEIWDNNTAAIGNDFAVDDFSLTGPPQPFTLNYSVVNPSCLAIADGSIVGYGSGGNPPYVYTLSGPNGNQINGTGIFTGLATGTYSLNILEGADGEITINNIILSFPPGLTVSNPVSICPNASTTLTVSGGSSYTWSSVPFDDSLVTNVQNPTVSPDQTTTYTVVSSSINSRNLVYNGDFSLGNVGFVTDYNYLNPVNPNGAQRAYGITTNANLWSNFFSNCTDHTIGTGNMLIVDGSNINAGNDRVWCQTIPVIPNQNYTFNYWVQTVALPSVANLATVINGQTLATQTAPSTTCNWQLRSYTWNSGTNTMAQICIYNRNTEATGNDFALDDISFTPPPTTCNLSASVVVTVSNGTIPDFPTTLSLCQGALVPSLETTSPNGISGTWTPSTIDNNTSGTYEFQPNANQCATNLTLQVTVNEPVVPTFNITNPICEGTTTSPLPTISLNNIAGVWTPEFDNTQTTLYTFNPAPDQCGGSAFFELSVDPPVVPTFSPIGAFCKGKVINDPLPQFSTNGISGSWTPIFNTEQTTTYTFTPDAGQCATTTTLEVVIVESNLTPTFNFGPNITTCFRPIEEVPPALLPEISDNGIPGYWTPASINYSLLGVSEYVFTPIVNTCASNFVLSVNVVEAPDFIVNSGCVGDDFVLSVTVFEIKENSNFTWYNEQNEIIGNQASVIITEKGKYKVVKETNGCVKEKIIDVSSVYCKIPKGISPNDDTLNDYFDLTNLNVKQLQIYNRYGTEVYSKTGYKKEWDGKTNSGKTLPDGTYYYVIDFENAPTKTGWVYINK